jgi:glycosyltransferase involved in cell wall biosynthesis
VQCLQGNDPERGIPRWVLSFVTSLRSSGVTCVGLTNPELQALPPLFANRFDAVAPNTRPAVREVIIGRRVSYLVASPLEPVRPIRALLPDHILQSGIPVISIIHDLALYLFPQFYQIRKGDVETYRARQLLFSSSDMFWAVSKHSQKDVVRLWGVPDHKVHFVGTGIDEFFIKSTVDATGSTRPGGRFVFSVGRSDPRKQTTFTIKAFAGLSEEERKDLRLVIACRLDEETRRLWKTCAAQAGLSDQDLVLTGLVDDFELRRLYQSCDVFIEPSLYEGFGLPAGEAAACGAVVITSNTSSLPEILDFPESSFDPYSLDDAVCLLRRALFDEDFRTRNKAAGRRVPIVHNWSRVAGRAQTLLAQIAKETTIPNANRSGYLRQGFPEGAIGRTIPLSCLDD